MSGRDKLGELAERAETISAYNTWNGNSADPEGDMQAAINAIHDLRDILAASLRALAGDGE